LCGTPGRAIHVLQDRAQRGTQSAHQGIAVRLPPRRPQHVAERTAKRFELSRHVPPRRPTRRAAGQLLEQLCVLVVVVDLHDIPTLARGPTGLPYTLEARAANWHAPILNSPLPTRE